MKKTRHYTIIISLDALSSLDFEDMIKLPNFSGYISNAAYCRNVYSVYPSLTYPAHTSIITGNNPGTHGVVNNTLLQPGRKSPDWYWYRKYINGTTLYDEAAKSGLKTASLLWPVTGRSSIKFNMPEIFANRPWQNQIFVSLLSGSPIYQFLLNKKFGHIRKGLQEPELDNFVHQCALYTIKNKKPELMLIHYTDLDSQRHAHGFSSVQAADALRRHDIRLGEIIETLKDTSIYSDSSIIVLGDHSSLDEGNLIRPNALFREHGLIKTDNKGRIVEWKAISKSCDGSCYIYLKSPEDRTSKIEVESLLKKFIKTEYPAIESIINIEEARELGADPKCTFMLEAGIGYYFSDSLEGKIVSSINFSEEVKNDHITKATHGYSPLKPHYETMFFAAGKGVRSGTLVDRMNLIDEGPTIAKLMGLELKGAQGRIIDDILDL